MLDRSWIDEIARSLPELPAAKRRRFAGEYRLGESDIDTLTASVAVADYFEQLARAHDDPKAAANWMLGPVFEALRQSGESIRHFRVRPADLARLLDLVRDGMLSSTAAKQVFARMVATGDRPEQIAEREQLLQVRDDDALERWVDEVLAENPTEAERFRHGERKLQGVLVGLVMKKSKGRADPKRVNQLLSERSGA